MREQERLATGADPDSGGCERRLCSSMPTADDDDVVVYWMNHDGCPEAAKWARSLLRQRMR